LNLQKHLVRCIFHSAKEDEILTANASKTRISGLCVALFAVIALIAAGPAGALSSGLQVKQAKTRIGIAKVILQIDGLNLTGSDLVGDYRIRIPLAPFMDDRGSIRIEVDGSLQEAVLPGSILLGSASSEEDGRVHHVACTFLKGARVNIVVTTPSRVLDFEAPFNLNL
jgi:hypothetical protein